MKSILRHLGLKLNIPPWLFCMSQCPDFECPAGHRMLFLSAKLSRLSHCSHAAAALLYPLQVSNNPARPLRPYSCANSAPQEMACRWSRQG